MAGLWTPGANLTRQFDLDRYFLNGSGDAVELLEPPAIRQREIDGDSRCERSIRAHVRLGPEDHDDGRAVVEMGIEVPPLVAALFRADTLAILGLSHFDGIDAQFLIVGGPARQPKMVVLVARHDCAFEHGFRVNAGW